MLGQHLAAAPDALGHPAGAESGQSILRSSDDLLLALSDSVAWEQSQEHCYRHDVPLVQPTLSFVLAATGAVIVSLKTDRVILYASGADCLSHGSVIFL